MRTSQIQPIQEFSPKNWSEKTQSYVGKFGDELHYDESTIEKAINLAQDKELYPSFQHQPRVVAITSLYVAGLSNFEYYTRKYLEKVSKVNERTISILFKELIAKKIYKLKDHDFSQTQSYIQELISGAEKMRMKLEDHVFNRITYILQNLAHEPSHSKKERNKEMVAKLINELFF